MDYDVNYVQEAVGKVLAEGLRETYAAKPADPIEFLAKWLHHYRDEEDQLKAFGPKQAELLAQKKAFQKQQEEELKRLEEERKQKEEEERRRKAEEEEKERIRLEEEAKAAAKEEEEQDESTTQQSEQSYEGYSYDSSTR